LLGQLKKKNLVTVGFAADGFQIIVSHSGQYQTSYRLKTDTRPSGPGGRYDSTYTQDFTYEAGFGDLDECNGTMIDGKYTYVLTENFPFIPRCWKGAPDAGFKRKSPGGDHRFPPPHHRRTI
jgi:hypothetical protein